MMKVFIKICLILALTLIGLGGCLEKSAPPTQWPDPGENLPVFQGKPNNLPLEESPQTDMPSLDIPSTAPNGGDNTNQNTVSYILAEPKIIYTKSFAATDASLPTISTITVSSDTFVPYISISIYGMTDTPSLITSPPYVFLTDINPDEKYIQNYTDDNGGITFDIHAGDSPGGFAIYVTDNEVSHGTYITIKDSKDEE